MTCSVIWTVGRSVRWSAGNTLLICVVYGHFGSPRVIWVIFCCFWSFLVFFNHFCVVFDHFGHFSRFWAFKVVLSHFEPFWDISGHFWSFNIIFGMFWLFMSFCSFWSLNSFLSFFGRRMKSCRTQVPCFPSLQFTITQSRATGIPNHILPLGDLLLFFV